MKCSTQPVWIVIVNEREIRLCGRCLNQLALNGEDVSQPLNKEPLMHSDCECSGCGKH